MCKASIHFNRDAIVARITNRAARTQADDAHIVEYAISQRKRGVEKKLVLDSGSGHPRQPDPSLIELVVRSRALFSHLTDGSQTSMQDIASRLGMDRSDFSRFLPLASCHQGS